VPIADHDDFDSALRDCAADRFDRARQPSCNRLKIVQLI
jgi:hypothetical protein